MGRRIIKLDRDLLDDTALQLANYVYSNPFVNTKQLHRDLRSLRESLHSDLAEKGFADRILEHIRSLHGQTVVAKQFGKPICIGTIVSGRQCKYFVYDTPSCGHNKFSRNMESIKCVIEVVLNYRRDNPNANRWNEVSATVDKTGYPHGSIDNVINNMDNKLKIMPRLRYDLERLAEAVFHKQEYNDSINKNIS